MEYFLGSFFTLLIFIAINFLFKDSGKRVFATPKITQSSMFSVVAPYVPYVYKEKKEYLPDTQSRKHLYESGMRVVIYNDNAYWLQNNIFYTAKLKNGIVDQETQKVVDTMSMSKVELKEIEYIVYKLTEGIDNDSSNSGNEKLF